MTTAAERAELEILAELDKRPTATQRVARTTGQGGFAYVVLDAAVAFHWFGAQDWNEAQNRAAMALAVALVAAAQNLGPKVPATIAAWWRSWRS